MVNLEDTILDQLLDKYNNLMRDLHIGYPISEQSLNCLWDLVHKRHYVLYENDSRPIFNLLEYYEYV
jgi:hypothetical protein